MIVPAFNGYEQTVSLAQTGLFKVDSWVVFAVNALLVCEMKGVASLAS